MSYSQVRNTLPRTRHRDYLDGIRALAALWVVLSHLWIGEFGLNVHRGLIGALTNWALYSHLAVDVFIVLSGFCLILPVAQAEGVLKGGALAFFHRRARRILPPYYAALILSLVLFLLLPAINHKPLHFSLLALAANLFLLQDVFLPLNIFNGPFWSIAVEWRIYFIFPLLVLAARRWGWSPVLVGAALLSAISTAALFRWHPEMILACPWYLFLFTVGTWAGYHSEREASETTTLPRGWITLACTSTLALSCLLWLHPVTERGGADFGLHMPWVDAATGLLTASCLFLMGRHRTPMPLISWRPLVMLGTFAYSLYLTHMPLLNLSRSLLHSWLPSETLPLVRLELTALTLPLIIGLAYLFFLTCERPFIRRRTAPKEAPMQEILPVSTNL
jgi:peptidoglycan/LPS O-acetylase OafA/YrhL